MVNHPASRRRHRQGFTLIELLVVVSIITLLISILLPAVGQVRRQAQISNDIQDMKQHATATFAYAAARDSELPNAPRAPRNFASTLEPLHGIGGQTSFKFAFDEFETNGVQFGAEGSANQDAGIYTLTSPRGLEVFNGTSFASQDTSFVTRRPSMLNAYWAVLGQFMEGGTRGLQTLTDIWVSDADNRASRNQEQLKQFARTNGGELPNAQQVPEQLDEPFVRFSSYRYVPTAITDTRVWNMQPDSRSNTVAPGFGGLYNIAEGPMSQEEFYLAEKRNRTSDLRFGSRKVLFYMILPFHDPPQKLSWFFDGVNTPVALGDGSARNTSPQSDGAPYNPLEDAGSPLQLVFVGDGFSAVFDAYYVATEGGIKGRDLR